MRRLARHLTKLILCALISAPLTGYAKENLWTVYQYALANDPQLEGVHAGYRATRSTIFQSAANLLPSLSVSADTFDNRQDILFVSLGDPGIAHFNSHGYVFELSQPLYRHDRWIELYQSSLRAKESEAQYQYAEQELILRVTQAYADVLNAQRDLEFSVAEHEAVAKQLEQAEVRFEVGAVAITEKFEAQARFDLTYADTIRARNRLDNALIALKEITGIPILELASSREPIEPVPPHPNDIDVWKLRAMQDNLQIHAAQKKADTAKQEIWRRRTGHLPNVDFKGRASYTVTGGRFGDFKSKDEAIGIEFSMPLFQSGLVLAQTAESKHLYSQSLAELDQKRRQVERETSEAFLGVIASVSQIKAFKQAVASNQTALTAIEEGYKVGTRDLVDVLDAQSDLFSAQKDLVQASYDYVINQFRLKLAAGSLHESDLLEINTLLEPIETYSPRLVPYPQG